MTTVEVDVRHFTHEDLPRIRQILLDVHAETYAEDPDDFHDRFPWFVDHWGSNPGFSCTLGYEGSEPVGFAYGAPATPHREWWREHISPAPEKSCTFSVSELMVRPRWRKTGTAKLLHHALLNSREDDLAVLLVDVTHLKVQKLYESWGYHKVGEQQPFPDSPLYSVMLAELPLPA